MAAGAPSALAAGLGGNDLWRLPTADGAVVLRIFPADTADEVAGREAVAHRFAILHGLAAPVIVAQGRYADRPVLVMSWVQGESLATALRTALRTAGSPVSELGRCCGATLARLHAITEQPPEPIGARPWIGWAGEMPAGLIARLAGFTQRRLLHLDFHPANLIVTAQGEFCVLDWANVRLGPPPADLARTVSILELVRDAHPDLDARSRAGVDVFTAGLLAGYAGAGGDAELPAPIRAWAYAVQIRDLAGSWVPDWYFARLRRRCGELAGTG